jgi:CDGSH-type Zn-finger protein
MKQKQSATLASYKVVLEPGTYWFCACGHSKKQPLCDSSHKQTEIKPIKFEISEKRLVKLCGCKESKLGHICDNSHRELKKIK